MNNYICYVAGHSGGHIIPCATQALKEKEKIIFVCSNSLLDKKILNNYKFENIFLPCNKLPKNLINFFKFLIDLLYSFIKILFLFLKKRPKKVVSMGGLISIPVCFAAKILKIKVELWELNVQPGKTINFLSKFVDSINICFEDTAQYFKNKNCNMVNYPIRFSKIENKKSDILKDLNFSIDRKTVFVIGGSQGSKFINTMFLEFIKNCTFKDKLQIIHQTGNDNFNWQAFYKENEIPAVTFTFNNNMQQLYFISDLIICRSGAGTLAEVLFFEKKCLTIPLQTSYTSHQKLNALTLEKKHPNLINVILQNNNFEIFNKKITELIF